MGWIEVTEPFARPPRRPGPRAAPRPAGGDAGVLIDRGMADLDGLALGSADALDLTGCDEFELRDALLTGRSLTEPAGLRVSAHRSTFDDCDLSRTTVGTIRRSRLVGCKLIGADLSGASVVDTVLERCNLRYANLRMASLLRVRFDQCLLDDVDGFELTAEDVSFPGSRLTAVNVDRLQATRVDLREASELALSGARRLAGCLVADHQLPALSYSLALAVGLDLEGPAPGD